MLKINRLFYFSFVILFFTNAFADLTKDLFLITGTMAGFTGAAQQAYLGRLPDEIEDWKGPSGTTIQITQSCDLLVETRLLKGNRKNVLFVGLSNPSPNVKNILFNKVEFHFESGKTRISDSSSSENSFELKSGWYAWGLIPFPRKVDFKGEKSLVFKLPIVDPLQAKTCVVSNKHLRNEKVPELLTTSMEYTTFNMSLEFGSGVFSTGKLESYHEGSMFPSAMLTMNGFRSMNHGSQLLFHSTRLGAPKANYPINIDKSKSASLMTIGYGYTYRDFIKNQNNLLYASIGAAYSSVSLSKTTEQQPENFSYFSAYVSFVYDYVFTDIHSGFWMGSHAVGFTVLNNYIPEQTSKGIKMDGLNTSVLLRYRVGL